MLKLGPLAFLRNPRGGKVSLKVPSETRYIRKVSARILDSIGAGSIDEGRIFDIKLCIEEATRNAIVHGNHSDKRLPVRVSYWIEADKLHIEVEDEGPGFDHKALPDPTSSGQIMKNSGRGVYLIKKLMDKVEFNDKGNKITLVKDLR